MPALFVVAVRVKLVFGFVTVTVAPTTTPPEESVALAEQAIAQASVERAGLICFPECYVPGYRLMGRRVPPPDAAFLERAWARLASAAAKADIAVILGTERVTEAGLMISAMVVNRDGTIAGFQDKVQMDPSEDGKYVAGSGRRVFETGPLKFGFQLGTSDWLESPVPEGLEPTRGVKGNPP